MMMLEDDKVRVSPGQVTTLKQPPCNLQKRLLQQGVMMP